MAPYGKKTATDTEPKLVNIYSMLLLIYSRNIIAISLLVAEILIAKHGQKSSFFIFVVNFDVS